MATKKNCKGGPKPRFSPIFMRQVVRALIEENLSYREAAKRFNVPTGAAVYSWYKRYGAEIEAPEEELMQENNEGRVPEGGGILDEAAKKRVEELEKALSRANLKILGLETMIDVAEEVLHIEIRKKSGAKPSNL